MKYNPRINELTSSYTGFTHLHPMSPERLSQGALTLMAKLESLLAEISGFARVTLQPAAGAQGEYTGLRMIRACLEKRGDRKKTVLIPESAHGTNPATAALCGYQARQIKSGANGRVDIQEIEALTREGDVAALMITNPNTLGLFETEIQKICQLAHERGALVYCDGANLNAMLGITRPGDSGIDVMHFNMHKTFTTPHGGGGPGCGGVGLAKELIPFMPRPTVEWNPKNELYYFDYDRPDSIGFVKDFYGHFLMMVRAYTYIRELGPEGIRTVGENAILLANFIRQRLKDAYHVAYDEHCMHEVVLSDKRQNVHGIKTLDIAKRLIDEGFHPPTVYFPLLVPGAIMIEPTETESLETVDAFCDSLLRIAAEAEIPNARVEIFDPSPQTTPVRRVDETKAARDLILSWKDIPVTSEQT